jgi:hypothetical protein
VDPLTGGSASAYDYANADPVNQLDLSGLAAGGIICGEHLEVHHPHRSSHNAGRVNAVLTGQCVATGVTTVRISVTLLMYRNGDIVRAEPTKTFTLVVNATPSTKPTFKIPFKNAPACRSGTYQAVALVTVDFPPGYVPGYENTRIESAKKYIQC